MAFFIGRDREARRAYGFDEIALVPGDVTVNPDEVDTTLKLGPVKLEIPFLASAMDGVVDTEFAIAMGKLGGQIAVTGPLDRRGRAVFVVAVVALPWLSIKYALVAAACAARERCACIGHLGFQRKGVAWQVGELGLARRAR